MPPCVTPVLYGRALYALDEELIRELRPDIVITQDLCHVCAVSGDDVGTDAKPRRRGALARPAHASPTCEATVIQLGARLGASEPRPRRSSAGCERHDRRDAAEAVAGAPARARCSSRSGSTRRSLPGHWVPEMVAARRRPRGAGRSGGPSFPVTWDDVAAAGPDVVDRGAVRVRRRAGPRPSRRESASPAGRSPSRPTPTTRGPPRAWRTASPSSRTSSIRRSHPTPGCPRSHSNERWHERDGRASRAAHRDRIDQPGPRARRLRRGRDRGVRGGLARGPRPRRARRRGCARARQRDRHRPRDGRRALAAPLRARGHRRRRGHAGAVRRPGSTAAACTVAARST